MGTDQHTHATWTVAQAASLLYRRLPVGMVRYFTSYKKVSKHADPQDLRSIPTKSDQFRVTKYIFRVRQPMSLPPRHS